MANPTVRAARRSGNCARANASIKPDVNIVAEKLERDWERGCAWLAVAVAMTFGPMMLWAAWWGW